MYLLTAQGMSAVRRQATEIIMKELIQILEGLERDSLNMVLTVVGPELTGEKCLLADGKLLWESEQGGFFAEHLTEAAALTRNGICPLEGKQVLAVLEQNAHPGGIARNYHRCIEAHHIPIRYRRTVREIHGMPRITGVTVEDLDSGELELLPCDTLVTAVGLVPERELVRKLGEPHWLFLAGNCSRVHELADSAAEEGAKVGRYVGSQLVK